MAIKIRINTLTQLDVLIAIVIEKYKWHVIPTLDGSTQILLQPPKPVLLEADLGNAARWFENDFSRIAKWDVLSANHWTPDRSFETWRLIWDFPCFSTNMGTAWRMAMSAPRGGFYLTEMSGVGLWQCNMLSMSLNDVDAATPEIAICLAALRASDVHYERDFEFGEKLKPLLEVSTGIKKKLDVLELQ